eukprot:UN2123
MLKAVEPVLASTTNKHIKVACTSVLLNIAIVLHECSPPPKVWDKVAAALVARIAIAFLVKAGSDDGDAAQRAALAIGTLLPRDRQNDGAIVRQCLDMGLASKLGTLEDKIGGKVVAELRKLFG